MIRTDGKPTIAWAPDPHGNDLPDAPRYSDNDPGDEHDELHELRRRVRELEQELDKHGYNWPPAEPLYGGHN